MSERLVLCSGVSVNIVAQDSQLGDAENFVRSRSDEETLEQLGAAGNVYTVERVKENMPTPSLEIGTRKVFTILNRETQEYLGDIRLVKKEDFYEIGIAILPEYRCHGFGSDAITSIVNYAFNELNTMRVYLRVYQNNPRARRLYERLGFVYDYTEDDNYFIRGENVLEDWMYIERKS